MWPLREWASQSPSEWEGGLGLFLSGRSLSNGEECSLLQAGLALGTPVGLTVGLVPWDAP